MGKNSLRRNEVAIIVNKRVPNAALGYNLKNDRMISVHFQGKPFSITVIQVYAPNNNAEEAEVEQFYEDLQDLLEPIPPKDVLFIIGDWNAKAGSQEIPEVTGKFDLGVQNEAGKRLTEFCQENALVIVNTLFQQHKRRLRTWTSPDGQHRNQIDYILCSQRWRSSIQSTKTRLGADCGSDHEFLNSLLPMLCYAKSLQSCPTQCNAIDGSPPGSPVPGILQARPLESVAISFSNYYQIQI